MLYREVASAFVTEASHRGLSSDDVQAAHGEMTLQEFEHVMMAER